ncbi:MAG TPA: lactate racemase domain-containing protein, partial [Terriglobia bacterium]|nr:lactate racemase domain-containing protein [Terriglobia bacterium]
MSTRGATESSVVDRIAEACPASDYRGKKVLMIVPDGTRTAPVGLLFHILHGHLGPVTKALDVMVALGTHPPMSEGAICRRLEISESDRHSTYSRVQLFNHEWHNPTALKRIGEIAAEEIHELSGGLFSRDVPVEINKRVFDYDRILIVGPVFPHEVVGFSGGNKYLFPGISGPELLNFFHWLGAVITTPRIIGSKWTPVRKVVDRAAAMLEIEKICIAMVVRPDESLTGLFIGTPEQAWDEASELSKQVHIVYKDYPFH